MADSLVTRARRGRKSAVPDVASRMPRYLQVASVLRRRVTDGQWGVGDKIATLEALEAEFGVARVTVRQAIDLLQGEGLLKSFQGRGTYVVKTPGNDRWLQLATSWGSLIAPIRENVLELLDGEAMGEPRIEPGEGHAADNYKFIRSVQKRGAEPYAYARVFLARHIHDRAPKLFQKRVALVVLAEMKGLKICRAHQTLTIGAADIETARYLAVSMNSPTAEARCVVSDNEGVVLYVGEITYRGDVVRLNIELIDQEG